MLAVATRTGLPRLPAMRFSLLGTFAIQESKRVWDEPDLGGMPQKSGIAKRLSEIFGQKSQCARREA